MPNFQNVICLWIKHPHTINQRRITYFEENKNKLIPVYLTTTASPEFMVIGESLEYSQARSTCPEILYIICKFKG